MNRRRMTGHRARRAGVAVVIDGSDFVDGADAGQAEHTLILEDWADEEVVLAGTITLRITTYQNDNTTIADVFETEDINLLDDGSSLENMIQTVEGYWNSATGNAGRTVDCSPSYFSGDLDSRHAIVLRFAPSGSLAARKVTLELLDFNEPAGGEPPYWDENIEGQNPSSATQVFTFTPAPTSGTWTLAGNSFAHNATPTATGWSIVGTPASGTVTCTRTAAGSGATPLTYSNIDLSA